MGSVVDDTAPTAVVGPCAGTPGLTCARTLMSLLFLDLRELPVGQLDSLRDLSDLIDG